jgi:hypothetical protein
MMLKDRKDKADIIAKEVDVVHKKMVVYLAKQVEVGYMEPKKAA